MTELLPRIVYETPDYIVLDKPRGMPSAPLTAGEGGTALEWALERFPAGLSVCPDLLAPGRKRIEHGLIHRLDTDTRGLVLVALTQDACGYFLRIQGDGALLKRYTALCAVSVPDGPGGFPPFGTDGTVFESGADISSFFRFYGEGRKQVRPVPEDGTGAALKKAGKRVYTTHIESVRHDSGSLLEVCCSLTQGFRHQIRCHLAWAGHPICGDRLYYPGTEHTELDLSAVALAYPDFGTGAAVCVSL